ncbi:MAG: type II toxin-antitoxin system YoeB family toxin [Sellimonas intestinalis]|uniref:type II toxin-antitoxin system YoeB family toxin n=1 Tax=Sellimonas intestinalis TaxID=1653434 RepID=UPI003992B3BE
MGSEYKRTDQQNQEPLKHNLSGWWNRRIDDTNHIVYYTQKGIIFIVSYWGTMIKRGRYSVLLIIMPSLSPFFSSGRKDFSYFFESSVSCLTLSEVSLLKKLKNNFRYVYRLVSV